MTKCLIARQLYRAGATSPSLASDNRQLSENDRSLDAESRTLIRECRHRIGVGANGAEPLAAVTRT